MRLHVERTDAAAHAADDGGAPCERGGADQYGKLASWHRPEEVRRLSRIAVFARPGFRIEEEVKTIALPEMRISASDIRARRARGEDVAALVPGAVADYIVRKGLYR